ncbi:HRDC domain protein [Desulfobulbus propionicus DSM 2032]|uniref:HRDC domain protein n=1 Tax=Desulfobulbus propionicus (strain ATCC 33891 / DSM 2032 / VKM B-1956 / 1pr3) TaxID=577650 RepID=A0A7U4DNS6_DESPD|nr:helix-turn-helix domain-containing protein [Desulfobulbus propionicus]ADW17332.1 HRDC domain protein [Desulfobulbus propionicus DSM 2032]
MSPPNPELHLAHAFVEHTNCCLFLTGKAGTGKTTFLHQIKQQTHKRLVVTAPTGVAAINAGGVTLHSFFQLPFGPFLPGTELHGGRHRVSREKRNIINSLDLLVIDEISMVRADLLDGVDTVLRRYRRSELPFGGVQLLMIGDLHQLPPVVKEDEWQLLAGQYASPYFFSSRALSRLELIPIELKHIYRQSDGRFIDLLNRVRDNRLDAASLATLNSRFRPDFSPQEAEGVITLCTHNNSADAINHKRLDALPGSSRCFEAGVEGSFPEYAFPTAASLELKVGAQVMFVRNDTSPEKRYFNGKIGTIAHLGRDTIRVDCPGEPETIEVKPVTWENIEYRVDADTAEISPKVVGSFNQVPLKPAWAITIHKSQGLTFDRAVIDAQDAFAHGQVYVALSRCRTFEGLVLSSPIVANAIRTDPAVLDFVAAIESQAPTEATLQTAKIRYQQQLLDQCYDFQTLARLLGRLVGLVRGNASIVTITAGADLFDVQRTTQEAICTVGDNFRRQLRTLFQADKEPARDPVIRERLAKAAGYFREQFDTVLKPCVDGLEVESDNKEVRKRINEVIKQLRQECAAKLAAIVACGEDFSPGRYLRALSAALLEADQRPDKSTSIYTEADVGHPELFRQLRHWRAERAKAANIAPFQVLHQKTLIQIAVHLPDSLKALRTIKGVGAKLAEKYGAEIVALVNAYRSEHRIDSVTLPLPHSIGPTGERKKAGKREDTKKTSLEMLRDGLSIAEIAAQRGLTTQTVEGHLAYFIKAGELAIDGLLPKERLRELEERLATVQAGSLKAVKEALGDDYTYGEINLVLAHLQHREGP